MTLTATDSQGTVLGTIGAAGGKLRGSNPGVQEIVDAAMRRTGSAAKAARALAGFSNGYVTISAGKKPAAMANEGEAIDLAISRVPVVRGAADVQMGRTSPGVIGVNHKSSGMKVGTITPKGNGWQGTHTDGTACPASGSQQGAMAGLIAYHNKMAAAKNAKMRDSSAKSYAGDTAAVDLASVPSVTSSDGPRVTTMGTGKGAAAPATSVSAEVKKVYARLVKKGMKPAVAMAFAKRAAAMHSKPAAKAA